MLNFSLFVVSLARHSSKLRPVRSKPGICLTILDPSVPPSKKSARQGKESVNDEVAAALQEGPLIRRSVQNRKTRLRSDDASLTTASLTVGGHMASPDEATLVLDALKTNTTVTDLSFNLEDLPQEQFESLVVFLSSPTLTKSVSIEDPGQVSRRKARTIAQTCCSSRSLRTLTFNMGRSPKRTAYLRCARALRRFWSSISPTSMVGRTKPPLRAVPCAR